MSEKELRELDAFCAKILDLKFEVESLVHFEWRRLYLDGKSAPRPFEPTRDPAAAMEVLEKCYKHEAISLSMCGQNHVVSCDRFSHSAPTLELAICLFAQKLFTP